nr:unnamed protein product [Spirometra erinaceieuropaei]
MTRVLIDNCHRRLQKYKAEIEENRRQCVHILGDSIAADLGKTISALAHHRQAKKREVLERKLTKLKPPGTERSNLVHNLSFKQLTDQQLRVLQHETCFSTADADPVDFIAALEAMLVRRETSDDMKQSVRQRVTSLLMTHRPTKCISQSESKAMRELRRDDSIIILPAEKGRSTVVMNREDYNEKAKALLDDREFYRPTQKSQAKAVADRLSKLPREYLYKNVITENEWHQMRATDTALARFYGLPKIHKANVPLRPIVALKGSPTYNLAKWMYSNLKFLQGSSTTSVRSASQFLIDLRGRRIQSDEIMVSFDVTSLFTSIPPNVVREVLRKRLEEAYDEIQNALKIEHLMRLFEFCQQTFFTFAGETYEQIKGTPMGSPVSGLVAELVLQELEKIAFLQHEPVFWRRYVDDTFVIVKKDMLQHFHCLLHAVFPDIKFTREEEQEQQLPFLDVLVRRNLNGELETTVYRKATNTTKLLSFHSNHPVAHKRSCVKTLFKRIQTHCSKPEDRAREARYLLDQFVLNGYPRAFISRCLRGRHQRTRTSTPPTIWHSLSYIKGVSGAIKHMAAELGVGIAHRPKATMRKRVMKIKDRLKPEEQSGVVYRIPCQNCPCNYTGQTGRMLGSRIHEHKLAVRRGDALSQVAAHTYEVDHEFDFAATKIVAHAGTKTGQGLIEAWASDENSVNRFIDLAPAYRALRSHLQSCDVGR